MRARLHRSFAAVLSVTLLVALFVGVPPRRVAAVADYYRVHVIVAGESDGSYEVPADNPDSITLDMVAEEFGYSVALLLSVNDGSGWGDCDADGTGTDYTWPTVAVARDGAATDFILCGGEAILFPKLVDAATVSIVAGAGSGTEANAWNGTSMISAITGASGTFTWDRNDYFGNLADPDSDGSGFEAAEMYGTKVVVSAAGFGVAATDLELTAWNGGTDYYTIVSLKGNGRPMEVVNAFGGQTTNVVADGAPCTFYTTVSTSPSLWRSFDCGGTWSPVVLSSDERAETTGNDGIEGMDKNSIVTGITTSGWPGEVAVIIQSKLWFSRDFGTTWNSFDLKSYTAGNTTPTALSGSFTPYWAHAYDEADAIHSSYLFLVGGQIGGPTGPLQALTVYATVMPTGDEYSVVDDNITGTDNPCDGAATEECPATEIKPGQFFALNETMKSNIAGAPGLTTRGTWTGWLFAAKPGVDHVYIATQQGATGGVVIAELPQGVPPEISGQPGSLFTSGDLKTALTSSSNFTIYDSEGTSEERAAATIFAVKSPYQDEDLDGCADGCAMSRDTTVNGGQAAQDLMVFGGPSGWLAEDINNDSTEDNGTLTTDYEGPRSVVIWDRSSSGANSTATVRIATWVTNDRAITALGSYDNTDHWETAATSLDLDSDTGDDHVIQNNLYSRGGNSQVGDGCSEDVETESPVKDGAIGQAVGGGDAECASSPRRLMATCGENTTPAVGSVAPMLGFQDATGYGATSGEYYGTVAMIRSCIVVHGINVKSTSDIGGAFVASGQTEYGHVIVMDAPGANNNTGSAFDAGFNFQSGSNGSSVVLSGDGARGLVKAATWNRAGGDGNVKFLGAATANYVPLFPQASHSAWNYIANRADPGTTSSSGGFAVTGLAAPVVRDTAFNPSDPDGVVATFSFTGGGRSVISYDGGKHYYTFAGGGSNSIAWWKGASTGTGASEQGNNWILSGSLTGGGLALAHFTDGDWLTAKNIANGVRGDDDGDLENGISGCEVGVDVNCVAVDFDAPVETLAGSALVSGAIREQRPNPGDPGAKITGCSDAQNEDIRGDMFDGEYFGLTGSADTVSITGIQGTDAVLVVLGAGPSSQANSTDAYTVVLMNLNADGNAGLAGDQPCVDDLYYLKGTSFVQHPGRDLTSGPPDNYTAPLGRVASAAYCPADGGTGNSLGVGIADAVEDLALIAIADESSTGGYDDGKIIKIKGIYSNSNSIAVSSPATTTSGYRGGNFRDMKMDCDTGLVFVTKKADGTGTTASTAATLYSLDGATTFAPMGFASSLALKNAISSAETIAVEADPTTGVVDVVVVASGGSVVSVEMDLEEMMPAARTLADLNDEELNATTESLAAVADDPSAEGDVSTVNDPAAADGFYFGGEKPGDIDYPASEDEAPDLVVDGAEESVFTGSVGFGIASVSDTTESTPIFGSGGGALDVTAQMAVFSFGSSLTVPYKIGHATTTSATTTTIAAGRWHALPTVATVSGAKQTYSVAAASSAYCEIKTVTVSGVVNSYLRMKKLGSCKVGITAAAAAPYLAGTNYYTYVLGKGVLAAPSAVPAATRTIGAGSVTLGTYADDANTAGYQATSAMPKITWSEVSGGTASANACKISGTKLTFAPVAGDATKTCKIKGTAASSANWGSWTVTYTLTFAAP